MLVHDRGYLITAKAGGTVTFYRPDGTLLPSSPALPDPEGTIEDCHDVGITPTRIRPCSESRPGEDHPLEDVRILQAEQHLSVATRAGCYW
jgi:hypothetical protein